MYYQLTAFVDEVRACEALPQEQRAKPWTYGESSIRSWKPCAA